ncbi:Uncharacterised protein [Klebsiella pneumoniae]|nr:Uncharacterised protein [Klebsiella pneumoniae]STS37653.1 Uncharacterised protein [Klebsiella pneumoniae]STS42455.1 Uncharacterised protein [Klebsiella pneumoniae]STS55043.1 Uncharacterised protein [Klebsiella pneumoniae]
MKKFELVAEMTKEIFGTKLFRIRALISFGVVDKGDLGGWVEKEDNLSQEGNAWVSGDAWVSGNASWLTVGPVGSENGFLSAFRQKDNSIMVLRGCFEGTIEEFESAVKETHGDNEFSEQYLALIPFIKLRLEEVEVSNEDE